MKMKSNIKLVGMMLLIAGFFCVMGCNFGQGVGFINPYDLVSAANSIDKTGLMQEMELSLESLGQVALATAAGAANAAAGVGK